ncbi:cysteine desulfurase family protein [Novacetimonas pomaceti]|uniref:Cysteine desulfurase n=1 Tax=Novacetimonas pomaceti TaxID=2021998 RepID=A0A318QAG2_9PROT|nr:cysteine desulfurase family protein [Novacetimonas pomaceti]PYD74804.1 hypothetical protein CFR71_12690 [Novacetimonas pomaceti]
MMDRPIYLDNFSTTSLSPYALSEMTQALSMTGNASSPHVAGARALARINDAREKVADLIGALPVEIFFTSGATEANNLVLRGMACWAKANEPRRRRIIISAIEHKSVLETALSLTSLGFEVVQAPVRRDGLVDPELLSTLVDGQTLLVSLMHVNNETGIVQPIGAAVDIAHGHGALFHCDAAQAVGKLPVDVLELGVDYLSLSAHKCHGPMGIGALYIAADAPKPFTQNIGGGQERGVRSGTEPVPLIVGFGAAAAEARHRLPRDAVHSAQLVTRFLAGLDARHVRYHRVSIGVSTIPGGITLIFPGVCADELVNMVSRELCISTGSACNRGSVQPSYVFTSMGFSKDEANNIIRFSFSRFNTFEDADGAAMILAQAIETV